MLSIGIAVSVVLTAIIAGALYGESPTRRALALAVVAVALVLPFFAPHPAARGFAALGAVLGLMRVVEAMRSRSAPVLPRAIAFFLPIDLASLRRAPPALLGATLMRSLVHAVVAASGLGLLLVAEGLPAPEVARWAGLVLLIYGLMDAVSSALRAMLRGLGFESAPMQADPILSASVGEFWGERWNRAVGAWLRRQLFFPVARRRGRLAGLVAAFGWSGIFHAYAVFAAAGLVPALAMLGFFLVEAALVALEARLGVRRWPRPLAHAWTLLCVLGPSPLFVEPFLASVGSSS